MIRLAAFMALFATPAFAHSWYSTYCCNTMDCAPIPEHAVEITPQGFKITLQPGEHPMVKDQVFTATIPHGNELRSEDQDFHICIVPWDEGVPRCLYAPLMGF